MSDATDSAFDHEVDFLVVGSGAGGMTAGIVAADAGARVLLIEKSSRYGGSSAMSGGGLWVPDNHLMEQAGQRDAFEEALEYMKGTVGEIVPEERMRAYLESAPAMARYLSEKTRLSFHSIGDYADYYPDVPGAKEGGRCIEADAYHARELGSREFLRMRDTAVQELIMGRVSMTVPEAQLLLCRAPGWVGCLVRLMLAYALDLPWRIRSKRDRRLAMGNALVGRLRRSLMDRDVPIWLETPARRLLQEDGRVVGVEAEREGRPLRIRAERAVLLAAGGFEANQAMREAHLPRPTNAAWTCASPDNQGDAIQMGRAIGAAVDLMDDAWWGPTIVVPSEDRARMLVIEKSLPGGIMVNRAGRRFVKETAAYIDVVNVMYGEDPDSNPNLPAYLIFDATYRKKYPCGPLLPGSQQPDWAARGLLRQGFVKKAKALEALAQQLEIDPAGLRETVSRFNEQARSGVDLDFHRGETAFDRFYGDPAVEPNPCMAPLEAAPFYGMEVFPGELGTKGGLRTDAQARVLDEDGAPIAGLYATGNCSASVMGRTYPGPGSTLGPAATFGYVAARHALGVAAAWLPRMPESPGA